MRVCRSPWLIAAYHGLPRLRVPRHPPHAFARLTTTCVLQAKRLHRSRSFGRTRCPTIYRVSFVDIHCWTKSRSLNKDSKSAIYHYIRCQTASTHTRPDQADAMATVTASRAEQLNSGIGCGDERLTESFRLAGAEALRCPTRIFR